MLRYRHGVYTLVACTALLGSSLFASSASLLSNSPSTASPNSSLACDMVLGSQVNESNILPGIGPVAPENLAIYRSFILPAEPADVGAIKNFIVSSRSELGVSLDSTADGRPMYDDLDHFSDYYFRNLGEFYVIRDFGHNILGTVAFHQVDGNTIELKKLYVSRTLRGQGTGKELLDFVAKRARQLGYHHLILQTRTELSDAIKFYNKYGFHDLSGVGANGALYMGLDL